ncbi:MAG TPA: tetratricopeptide repeat protein, partial [Thermoplasmata archaeon]|nr:tetratricopeptide repeat protein [Thermoplasmata archaeon]
MLARSYDAPEGSEERKAAARASLVSYERASTDGAARGASLLGIGRAARLLQDEERAIRAYGEFLALPGNDRRPEVRTELGHALRDVGRLTEAEAEYSRAILLGSEESELLWSEVEVLSQLNQEARAVRLVDLLLQREPKNPVFLRRKGQLLLKSGRRAEGLAALRVAVEGSGGDPHALFEVAEALRATGAYADAVGFYRQGLAADPKSRPARLALAETLLLAGQYPEAVPAIDALLKEDPNDPRAWRARADAYRALGRPPEVLYSLKAILLLEPHNGPALLEKARIHLERSEKREAFDCLSTLARAGGPEASDGTLWLQVGDLAAALGETEEAQRSYERAAQLDASHAPEIDLRRARLRLSAGRPDLALEVLDAGADPKVAPADRPLSALLLRAEILTALERPGDAQKVYEDVRRREPRSPVAIAGLARSLLDQGKHAEARALLREVLPQIGPQESVYLLLGEAESGLGQLDAAVEAVRKGVELLPKSTALWVRLAELDVAQERWGDAATSYAHALALDGQNIPWLLRAGYVAERLGHPHEALALYDRATQVGPASKEAWCQRGLALLLTGQPEEALPSFDRALALDSDYAAAKDGRRTALQRTRESQIERHGRDALLLEARIHRPLTKNDLFVTLHTPFDLLEPVLAAIGRPVKVDLQRLPEAELQDLESASYHLITAALERRPEGIERRGFTLADVAVLSPPNYPLDKVQRLFGYLQAVLEADLRPENLRLAPDVEELARRAIQLPEAQRTLFQLVRTLRVGIYKARLIQIVEGAGHSGHAPLPSLDLGRYTPEFRAAKEPEPAEGDRFFAPENVPAWDSTPTHTSTPAAAAPSRSGAGSHRTASASAPPHPTTVRCVGCGGL